MNIAVEKSSNISIVCPTYGSGVSSVQSSQLRRGSGVFVYFCEFLRNNLNMENEAYYLEDRKSAGFDDTITNWLTDEFTRMNKRYVQRLAEKKPTSSMPVKLIND